MAMLLLQGAWLNLMFYHRNFRFFPQLVIELKSLVQMQTQGPKIDPCTKFQLTQIKTEKLEFRPLSLPKTSNDVINTS